MTLTPLSENLPPALTEVRARPLFTMRLEVNAMLAVGETPAGNRRVGLVSGGRFEGERLSGLVVGGGADWQIIRPDGAVTLDVRLHLQADDGALITMAYTGLRSGPREVLARLDKGEAVDPADYYFRTSARFETASDRYGWLNRIVAIGLGHRYPDGPVYNLFELL